MRESTEMAVSRIVVLSLVLPAALSAPQQQSSLSTGAATAGNQSSAADSWMLEWKRCADSTNVTRRLEALPGIGWDNLANVDMGLVVEISYRQCRTTSDGKFLIPDNMFAIPVQRSQVSKFAEVIEHYRDYKTTTAKSMDFKAQFSSIGGSFSNEYQRNKEHTVKSKTVTTRVEIRHELYQIELLPEAKLAPGLRDQIFSIASLYQANNDKGAMFETHLLVRDFGTHFVRAVVAGGNLVNEEYVSRDFYYQNEETKHSTSVSASQNFFGDMGFNFKYSNSDSLRQKYLNNRTQSMVRSYGGSPYRPDFTVADWENSLESSLVAIDRRGDPLEYLVTVHRLPELPPPTVMQVARGLEDALAAYYQINTHEGCMNVDSLNYNYHANVDDGSCANPPNNYTFGGIYQTCVNGGSSSRDVCSTLTQKNPLTGDFSCPDGYQSVLLHQGVATTDWNEFVCQKKSHKCGLFGFRRCNRDECGTQFFVSQGTYEAYWCVALKEVKSGSGYLFGGLFTDTLTNPTTGARSCPKRFYPLQLGAKISVCVSQDYELGYRSSMSFAGFYSCSVGNPLAVVASDPEATKLNELGFGQLNGHKVWTKGCPAAYSQHLASIDDGCEIHYCVRTGALSHPRSLELLRPPYGKSYREMTNDTRYTNRISSPDGAVWAKSSVRGRWELISNDSSVESGSRASSAGKNDDDDDDDDGSLRLPFVVGIAIGAAVLAILCTACVMTLWRRRRYRQRQKINYDKVPLAAESICSIDPSASNALDSSKAKTIRQVSSM